MPVKVAPDVETGHSPMILLLARAGSLQLPADLCFLLCSHSTPSRTTDLRPHVLKYLLLSMLVSAGLQALSLVSPGRCPWRLRTNSDLCAGEPYPRPPMCLTGSYRETDRQAPEIWPSERAHTVL